MNNLMLITLLPLFFEAGVAQAQTHKGISFQGVINLPSGEQPTKSGLNVTSYILSPNNCILREEYFSDVNISNGYINIPIGTGTASGDDPGLTLKQTMDNSAPILSGPAKPLGLACFDTNGSLNPGVTSFNPATSDGRRKFRLSLMIDSVPVVADFNMRSTAFAINAESADDAKKLNGKSDTSFLQTSVNVSQSSAEAWFSSTAMSNLLNNTYVSPSAVTLSQTLTLDKGGTGGTTAAEARTNLGLGPLAVLATPGDTDKVLYADGQWKLLPSPGGTGTISSISAGVGLKTDKAANAAITDSGTLSVDVGSAVGQIVQVQTGGKLPGLDGSSLTNVTASVVNPSATLNMTQNITTTENIQASKSLSGKSFYLFDLATTPASIGLKAPTDIVASGGSSYVLTLPDRKGLAGQVLAAKDATGTLEWISPSVGGGGTLTSVLASPPLSVDNSNAASPSLSIPKATNSVNGYLDSTDYTSFSSKQPAGDYIVTLQGDVQSSGFSNGTVTTSVDKIKNIPISAAPTMNGQVFRMAGGQLQPGFISMLDLRSNVTGSLALSASCTTNQTLTFNSATDSLKCENIGIASTQVSGLGALALKSNVDLSSSEATGVLPISKGGTGLSALGTAHQLLGVNAAATGVEYKTVPACGANQYLTFSGGIFNCSNDAGASGTVTDITSGTAALSLSASVGSVVANISDASTTAKGLVELAADGENAAGVAVQGNDSRFVNAAQKNAANIFSVGGQAINNNGSSIVPLTIKGAASQTASLLNVTASNNASLYTLKASGTPTDATDLTTKSYVDGLLSVQSLAGDVTGAFANVTVGKIQNRAVASTAPTDGQVLKWNNGSGAWEPAADAGTTYNAGTGLTLSGTTFSVSTVPLSNGGTGATTQAGAANAILPAQAGQGGKVLTTNGTNVSWEAPSGGGGGGLSGCPSGYNLIPANNTNGTNAFCYKATGGTPQTLVSAINTCTLDGASLCTNRQYASAVAAGSSYTNDAWTGDQYFSAHEWNTTRGQNEVPAFRGCVRSNIGSFNPDQDPSSNYGFHCCIR